MFKIVAKMYERLRSCVFTGNMKSNYFTNNAGVCQTQNVVPAVVFTVYK